MDEGRSPASTVAVAFGLLPGVIGLILGALYAMGAIQTVGQLEAENLKALDALPLIPLEQMLGRGISVLLLPIALALGMVALGTFYAPPHDRIEAPGGRNALCLAYLIVIVLIALLLIVFTEPFTLAILGIGALVGAFVYWQLGIHIKRWTVLTRYVLASVSAMFAVTVAGAMIEPEPMPEVELELTDGGRIAGQLVVFTGDTWYLEMDDDAISAISADDVNASAISPKKPLPHKTLFDAITGHEAGTPLF